MIVMLSVVMLSVVMLSVVMLSVVMLNVVMLCVVMLSVFAPLKYEIAMTSLISQLKTTTLKCSKTKMGTTTLIIMTLTV
jgi:hypothetical protein